ncbi:MAG: hypothetical protein WAV47_27120 [Blastocatellia bacterium]
MIRSKLFGALAVLALTVGVIAFIPRSQRKDAEGSKAKIEAVGLAEYGLEIIDPKHRAYDSFLAAEKKLGSEIPFSVFVVNNNDQAIAACTLKWEILLRDGQTAAHFNTRTGTLETVSYGGQTYLSEGIVAKGNLRFSLTDSSSDNTPTGAIFRTGGGPKITNLLSDSVKVIVSIDGVLFVDGTYAGPDTKNYFEHFKGRLEANRELDSEIAQLINDGAKPKAVMNHLEKVAKTRSSDVQIPPEEDPQYSFGKWMQKSSHARLLLLMIKEKGDQAVLERVYGELSKPPIVLRKLKQS